MLAAEIMERLALCGVRLKRDGASLLATPKAALNDDLRALIREHKAELMAALLKREEGLSGRQAGLERRVDVAACSAPQDRKARALAYLEEHPEAARACFADFLSEPGSVVVTIAVREPWEAVEMLVERSRFDAMALVELAARYTATSLFVAAH